MTALTGAAVAVIRRRGRRALGLFGVAAMADAAGRMWSRQSPGPLPASMRWVLLFPHAAGGLRRALEPRPGERVLEIGPGLGQHAVAVAGWVGPDGQVDVLDLEQTMLDETIRRAAAQDVENIVPTLADAGQPLPYPDDTVDAAYLMSVLGEVPGPDRVLGELRRVLRPEGRLVVGEVVFDPDFVRLSRLVRMAEEAGFRFDARLGPRFAYLARFVAPLAKT